MAQLAHIAALDILHTLLRCPIRSPGQVELAKATRFMGQKQFDKAVAVFKDFEKKEPRIKARAATNLAFLYYLEGEVQHADTYSELALNSDRWGVWEGLIAWSAQYRDGTEFRWEAREHLRADAVIVACDCLAWCHD